MLFTREKKCPQCKGINFTRTRAPFWSRWLLPNTRVFICNGCRERVYVLGKDKTPIGN